MVDYYSTRYRKDVYITYLFFKHGVQYLIELLLQVMTSSQTGIQQILSTAHTHTREYTTTSSPGPRLGKGIFSVLQSSSGFSAHQILDGLPDDIRMIISYNMINVM